MRGLSIFLAAILLFASAVTGYAAEQMEWIWNKTDTEAFHVSGSMTVDGGTMHNDWEHGKSRAVLGTYIWEDAAVNLKLQNGGNSSGSEVWVLVNMQDENNYYYVSFGGGTDSCPAIWKKENGGYEKLSQAVVPFDLFNNPRNIRVESSKGEISAYFGDELLVSAQDSTFLTGSVGLETWNSVLYMKEMRVTGSADKTDKWVWDGSAEGWSFTGNMKAKGGTISNDWDNKTASAIYFGVRWSEYTYEVSVQNEGGGDGNRVEVLFHYQNSRNYYALSIGGCYVPEGATVPTENSVRVYKIKDGNKEEIASYSGTFRITSNPGTVKIQYDDGVFKITGLDGEGNAVILFDSIGNPEDSAGMIGVAANASVGYFRNISVRGTAEDARFLGTCRNIISGQEDVATDIEPMIGFNMTVDKTTVYKSEVTVRAGTWVMPSDGYTISVTPTGELQITFVEPLMQKTAYEITIGTRICSEQYGFGMQEPLIIRFKTVPPAIDIVSVIAEDAEGQKVTVGEIENGRVQIRTLLRYSGTAPVQEYVLCTVLVDNSGTVLQKAVAVGNIADIPQQEIIHSLSVVQAECHVEVYMWDSFSAMHTLYPFVQIQ